MPLKRPPISVAMTTYNHEKYVAEAIQSVLQQTFPDFELIIVNDGSTDRTDEVIRSFNDKRIVYLPQENQGTSVAANNAVLAARGKYVALMCGDDVWYPNRLQRHYECLCDSKYKLAFCWLDIIDEDSRPIKEHPVKQQFDLFTNTRAQILRHYFLAGSLVTGVTAMVVRKLLLEAGLFHLTSIQAQDFHMWFRLATKYDPFILPERLVKYRIRANLQNLSSAANSPRTWFELYQIYRDILHEVPSKLFREAFLDKLKKPDFRDGAEFELEKAFIYLHHESSLIRTLGNEKLFELLRDRKILAIAQSEYGFGLKQLYELNKGADIANLREYEKLQNWCQTLSEAKEYLRTQLESRDQLITSKDQEIAAKGAMLAARDTTIAAQERELEIYRTSKWQHLRIALLYERFSLRKILKILYLITILATPRSVRERVEPRIEKIKRHVKALTGPKSDLEVVRQVKWPKEKPLLSVVIPCFNYGHLVEEAVDSVLSQTFQDLEIIVVDGGSTDPDTLSTLRSLQKPKTRVYFREGRHLVGDNRNFGISRAQGKYICCLDADDKLKPTYLEKALFLLETYHYDIVSASVQMFGASDKVFEVALKPSLEQIVIWNQISTVAVFSRKIWEKANGYHDWGLGKEHISEDWDLWVRMMALGARAINIPEPLMLYRVHGESSLSQLSDVPPYETQIQEIRAFNKQHLTRNNYLLSEKKNAAVVQVEDPNLNLVASYQKRPKKPRVLFALPFVITGGADTVFLQVADHLVANGFDLSIVTTLPSDKSFGDNTARYEAVTKQIYHLYQFLAEEQKWKDFLFSLIETRGIDVVFLAGSVYVYELLPEIKQKFPHVKVVDQLFNEFGHIANNRRYHSYIDVNIVANEIIRSVLVDRYSEAEDKVRVIVHGVDVEKEFSPENVVGADLAASGVLPADKFLVSFVGRFSEEKCPEMFIRMANLLKKENNLHFVMIGNGPEYPRIMQQIKELGLEDRVYAPGFVPDLKPFLKSSGVLVIPSRIEGIPIILMESLALAVPVIASNVGGIPSIIRDEFNGFICQQWDIEAFVRNIKRVATDEGLLKSLRANARDYALKHLSVERMKSAYLNVFSNLVDEGRTRAESSTHVQSEELLVAGS